MAQTVELPKCPDGCEEGIKIKLTRTVESTYDLTGLEAENNRGTKVIKAIVGKNPDDEDEFDLEFEMTCAGCDHEFDDIDNIEDYRHEHVPAAGDS